MLYLQGLYTCAWEGCRSPSSVYIEKAALWTHILQSHLQIILLPCPILGQYHIMIQWFPTLICCPDCAESFSQHLEITSHILTSHAPCLGSPKTALKRSAMPHHYPASSYDDLPYISNIVVNSFQISSPYVSTSSQISNPVSLTVHISFNGTILMTFSCCSPLIKLNQAHPQLNCSLPKDQAS